MTEQSTRHDAEDVLLVENEGDPAENVENVSEDRFATDGVVDEAFFRSLKAYLVPPKQRRLVLMTALVLSGALIVLGIVGGRTENLLLGALFAAVLLIQFFTLGDRTVNASVKRMKELTGGSTAMAYSTVFREDGVHVVNHLTGDEGVIGYGRIVQLAETETCLVLFSQKRQYIPVFKDGLTDEEREAFLRFIREKCPGLK